MMRSMFSGISGLRSHQTMMDVVGNNISNVNTPGYKGMRATFQESLTQVVRGATGPQPAATGGINPLQLGLGARLGSVDGVFGQGAVQMTGRVTDLSIQGEGFFAIEDGQGGFMYTRAGVFGFDDGGRLVAPGGERVALDLGGVTAGYVDGQGNIDFSRVSNVSIDATGRIKGRDGNAEVDLGRIRMALFANPGGLERIGGGMFRATANAQPVAAGGNPLNQAGADGIGTVVGGTLEMSNVDLAQEFTNLILAQRGFQANSRTITSSDEMLQDLVNLKR